MTARRLRTRSSTTAVAALLAAALAGVTLAPPATAVIPTPDRLAALKSTDYVVPAGATSVTVDMAGSIGKGGSCDQVAGFGGRTTATIPVTPGETLQINVAVSTGFNVSGNSSDVRRAPYGLEDRLVVAGGGGWNADHAGQDALGNCTGLRTGPGLGGDGGGLVGVAGNGPPPGCGYPGGGGGGGGTQSFGGAAGAPCSAGGPGAVGDFGSGGAGGGSGTAVAPCSQGGYGGDGWYGGGGGAGTLGAVGSPGGCTDEHGQSIANPPIGGGGGGGSSYVVPGATGVSFQPGVNGNLTGWVTVSVPTTPSVTAVLPKSGPLGGGRTVSISGSHLSGATTVTFGGTPATNVVVVSSIKVTARTPAHAAGTVDVLVTTPGGTSPVVAADHYDYVVAPVVTSVKPRRGPTAGGKTVTVLGTGFTTVTRVKFGTKKGKILFVSATRLRVRTPAHAAGQVDVRVTTPGGTSAKVAADRFTYR